MLTLDRRTLLYALGAATLAPLLDAATPESTDSAAVARPGESRFRYASEQQAKKSPCKLTSEDSHGVMSIFELYVPSRSGPVRHVHHREDEWCYVVAGSLRSRSGPRSSRSRWAAACWCHARSRTCGRTPRQTTAS